MQDGEKIFGEFLFSASYRAVENQEFSTVEFDQILDEFKPKARKAVTVGNHKMELFSIKESSQYGFKPFTLIVESTADVRDDFVVRESGSHELNLSLKIVSLLGTGNAAVADADSLTGFSDKRIDIVQSLSCLSSYMRYLPGSGPPSQGVGVNSKYLYSLAAWMPLHRVHHLVKNGE